MCTGGAGTVVIAMSNDEMAKIIKKKRRADILYVLKLISITF